MCVDVRWPCATSCRKALGRAAPSSAGIFVIRYTHIVGWLATYDIYMAYVRLPSLPSTVFVGDSHSVRRRVGSQSAMADIAYHRGVQASVIERVHAR